MKTKVGTKSKQSRKNKRNRELKKELGKKLLGYSVTAGAVLTLGTAAAEAVAIKTTPGAPITVTPNNFFSLDIDGDSNIDFYLGISNYSTVKASGTFIANSAYVTGAYYYSGSANPNNFSNQIAGDYTSTVPKALNLPGGISISSSLSATGLTFANLAFYGFSKTSGMSTGTTFNTGNFGRGFLGVSFEISDDYHFGWVDVEVNGDISQLTIYGWGYETVAGEGIETPIPEPATLLTLAMGAAGLYALRRNRKRKSLVVKTDA